MKTTRLEKKAIRFAFILALLVGSLPALAAEKPNIVLFIADDHGRNDSSVYDKHSQAITPNMARLAAQGITFNNAFVKALTGESTEHRDLVFTTHSGARLTNVYPIRSVRDKRFKYIRNIHSDSWYTTMIDMAPSKMHGGYFTQWVAAAESQSHAKAVLEKYHRRPAVEFYDIVNDPEETNNLASNPEYAAAVEKMAETT